MSLWSKSVSVVTATINAIKAVTDNIPNSGAMTSIAKTADLGAFSGQTNLKSLLAALGIPDVAGKPLYTLLVTDRLDDATVGLAALKAAIAAASPVVPTVDSTNNVNERDVVGNKTDTVAGTSIVARVKQVIANIGNFAGQTNLQSLLAALGIPDVSGKPLYTCLITDRLDSASYGLSALKTLTDSANSSGTFSYLDTGGEQTVAELTPTKRIKLTGIWLDLENMMQNGTIKLYYKIDGSTYRNFASRAFTVASDPEGMYIDIPAGINAAFKVTYTEGSDETAARDIPYQIIYDKREV